MKAHNAILDIDKKVITLKSNDAITMHKLIEMSDSERTYNVSMPSDVLIEKRSQVVLVAQVAFSPKQELVNSGKDVIFTPSPQVTERYNLLCANILGRINDDDKILVKFVNVTNDSVILKAGTRVGTIKFIVDERPYNAEVTRDNIGDRRRNNRYLRRQGNITYNLKMIR